MVSIDRVFNPVRNVTIVRKPVPGAKDPIEILTMEIETDGSITPMDAVSHSSTVLIEHFNAIEAIAKPQVLEVSEGMNEEVLQIRELLKRTIDEMELSVRSHNCLQAAGIKYIYELVSKEESAMLKYKNFGRKSLTELIEKLDGMGLSFGMDVDDYLKEDI
jgi:DNA-directed RNA polymerase subunit alpha